MKYYDIELNFYDYPIQYYEWSNDDNIERLCNVELIKLTTWSKYKSTLGSSFHLGK